MKICIVIPVHNELKAIGGIVKAIKAKGYDVVVIDDGSVDGCGQHARDHGAVVIRNDEKKGKGKSLQQGFEYAQKNGYDGVIAMDGDGQHDVNDIEDFVQKVQQEPECIVTGNRMHNPEGMPYIRLMTNRFMSWILSKICRQKIPDSQCGYRYISSRILGQLNLQTNAYEIESEVLIKASRLGCPIRSIPVKTIYGNEKSDVRPLRDTWRFFSYLYREMRSSR